MLDVVNFEKEMSRAQVRVAKFSHVSGAGNDKNAFVGEAVEQGKKRPSMQPVTALEDVRSSHERKHELGGMKKWRRLSRVKSHHDRFEDSDDVR